MIAACYLRESTCNISHSKETVYCSYIIAAGGRFELRWSLNSDQPEPWTRINLILELGSAEPGSLFYCAYQFDQTLTMTRGS